MTHVLKNKDRKKRAFFVVKFVLTVSLCLFLILKGDWAQVLAALRHANLTLLLVVFGAMLLCVTISAAKWQLLLSIHGISYGLKTLHHYYFVALFLNNFLPTNIGGDVYRIYKTFKNEKAGVFAILAVFLERVTGIWALLFLGLVGGIVLLHGTAASVSFLKGVTLFFAAGVFLPVIFAIGAPLFYKKTLAIKVMPAKLRLVLNHMNECRYPPSKVLQVILISFFFQIFSLGWIMLLFKAIGVDFPFFELVVTAAVSTVVAILPLSINGIGLLDGSFVYVATAFGISYDHALTYLLFMRSFTLLISLVGGLMYVRERNELVQEKNRMKKLMSIRESTP